MLSRSFWLEGAGSFVIAILIALTIRWAAFEAYVIPSTHMMPTLFENDHIFVNKFTYGLRVPFTDKWLAKFRDPQRGEVIVFRHPLQRQEFYVKRVVGQGGDRVFYENGNLYINDELIERQVPPSHLNLWRWVRDQDFPGEQGQGGKNNYAQWSETLGAHTYNILLRQGERQQVGYGPFMVPPGHFFVVGDNRDNSQDSRDWNGDIAQAKGVVSLTRQQSQGILVIPAGTIVRTESSGAWPIRFRTTREVTLENDVVNVPVEALEPGALANVGSGQISIIEGPLSEQLTVKNTSPVEGGRDARYVARDLVIGKAQIVWLSCEKKLPILNFLCHPLHMRWGRMFSQVN